MSKKLLITADLGHLKAFRLEEDEQSKQVRGTLLGQKSTAVSNHLSQEVTDQAGRFRKGTSPAGSSDGSDGEEHNLGVERRRRALKSLAAYISKLVEQERVEGWYLAAGPEINRALVEALERGAQAKLQRNVDSNLTKLGLEEVLGHFYWWRTIEAPATPRRKPAPGNKRNYRRTGGRSGVVREYLQNWTGRPGGSRQKTSLGAAANERKGRFQRQPLAARGAGRAKRSKNKSF